MLFCRAATLAGRSRWHMGGILCDEFASTVVFQTRLLYTQYIFDSAGLRSRLARSRSTQQHTVERMCMARRTVARTAPLFAGMRLRCRSSHLGWLLRDRNDGLGDPIAAGRRRN